MFPSLSALGGGAAAGLQDERYRTHRAVRELLEVLASTQPLAVVLDDLHWADSGSIELLGALLRSPPSAGVLLAIASRPRQTSDRLSAALERAERTGRLVRLELGALTRGDVHQLLGLTVDAAVTDALYEETGGNPFYLEELVRSLVRTAAERLAVADLSLSSIGVPRAVAAALAEELGLLSGHGRRILEAAAVAGDPFEPELLAAAAGRPTRRRSRRSTSCCGAISSATPTCRAAFASGTRSSAERCTTRRRRVADRGAPAKRRSAHGARRLGGGVRTPRRALGGSWRQCRRAAPPHSG